MAMTALQCTKSRLLPFMQHRYFTTSCLICICGHLGPFHCCEAFVCLSYILCFVYVTLSASWASQSLYILVASSHFQLTSSSPSPLFRTSSFMHRTFGYQGAVSCQLGTSCSNFAARPAVFRFNCCILFSRIIQWVESAHTGPF